MQYNATDVPFVLEFFTNHSPRNTQQAQYFWSPLQTPASLTYFISIKENIPLGIRLYAKDEKLPKDSKVIIESSTYDEFGKQKRLTIMETTRDHHEYLFMPHTGDEFPWRLGVYFLEVHIGQDVYGSGLMVSPIHLSQEQVQHMHHLLEQEIEGMIYDLIFTQTSTSQEHEILRTKSYYDYILRLINDKEFLSANLMQIERNPLSTIETFYDVGTFPCKQDQKSLRMKQVKGNAVDFNKRKRLILDLPANRWIKHVLLSWKNELLTVSSAIEVDLTHALTRMAKKEDDKRANEKHKQRYFNARDISYEARSAMSRRIYRLADEIVRIQREVGVLSRWHDAVQHMIGRIIYILVSTDLKNIPHGQQRPQLKEKHYRDISQWVEEGRRVLLGRESAKHIVRVLKPTWKVYEQFVYFQVVELVKRMGFQVSSHASWDQLRDLRSGTCLTLENDKYIIHAWYDRTVDLREDAFRTRDQFFSRQIIQPDIRLDLYKKGDVPMLLSCVAMDAKHRKYRSLYNEAYTNEVFTQLSKYLNIFYAGQNTTPRNKRSTVVHRVICLYSKDDNADVFQDEQPLIYIQLFPNIEDGNIIGLEELYRELSAWFEETVGE
ncbi:hypothetical protein [Paenibacillus riograndensis]|uniref:DUF2357 domain-containing protein n=1 Tax=Paenibacillus riograndensis SBR5 TaxID=1073571 RepID=A0A0E3WGC8_9BACL|nr:hypothetical protein [Paenibacillus riograndensis]CQR52546.1 hypothetical protein PRIO_0879 [Paenibacillus riograndensis SBR5]